MLSLKRNYQSAQKPEPNSRKTKYSECLTKAEYDSVPNYRPQEDAERFLAPDRSTGITLSTPQRRYTTFVLWRFSMATFIVGLFVVIIVGAASAFAYIMYLSDDGGRTGP